ncbi:hypothetical protein EVG20_g11574, partial [Dentipellis fragilis]
METSRQAAANMAGTNDQVSTCRLIAMTFFAQWKYSRMIASVQGGVAVGMSLDVHLRNSMDLLGGGTFMDHDLFDLAGGVVNSGSNSLDHQTGSVGIFGSGVMFDRGTGSLSATSSPYRTSANFSASSDLFSSPVQHEIHGNISQSGAPVIFYPDEIAALRTIISEWAMLKSGVQTLSEKLTSTQSTATGAVERLTSVEAKVGVLEQRASSVGPVRNKRRSQRGNSERASRNTALEAIMHKKVICMLGIQYRGKKMSFVVPDIPDPHPIDPPHDGEPWTPIWTESIGDSSYNGHFIDRVHELCMADEANNPEDK